MIRLVTAFALVALLAAVTIAFSSVNGGSVGGPSDNPSDHIHLLKADWRVTGELSPNLGDERGQAATA